MGDRDSNMQISTVPFSEPPDLHGQFSPHYNAHHTAFRTVCRNFVEKELIPFVEDWDEAADIPSKELRLKAYAAGIYAAFSPAEFGGTPPAGSEGDWKGFQDAYFKERAQVDPFFDLIMWDELARAASGGLVATLFGSGPAGIGLPPILMFGSKYLQDKIARDVVIGQKTLCLCVTEPSGGSDVAATRTTAVKDGNHYVLNGSKKGITGGMKAEYFTVVCRTDESKKGAAGMSMLLVENTAAGIQLRRMKTQGWWMSNTAFIEFDNVRVPVENLVGEEGQGFKYTMMNFNHERFMMCVQTVRFARVCLEESVEFGRRRKTFGKRLIDQLGGYIALMKVDGSRLMEFCAREASQIFGGQSFTREGAGGKVERIYREVRVMAIGGGSEEVMLNLAMGQAKL